MGTGVVLMDTQGTRMFPDTGFGWFAAICAAVGLGAWIALPIITSVFQDEYPLTDSYLMPVLGVSLTVLAAVVNVMAVWKGHQRSVVSLVAMFLTVMASLSFGLIVIGEGLSGA